MTAARAPRGGLAAAALLALAGCAGAPPPDASAPPPPAAIEPPAPLPAAPQRSAPQPTASAPARRPPGEPRLAPVRLAAPGSIARDRVERLAVTCWLDAELAAEIMVVDRRSGDMVAAGADGELLRIAFAPAGTLDTDVQLSGPALADPGRRTRIADALRRALEGAEPAC